MKEPTDFPSAQAYISWALPGRSICVFRSGPEWAATLDTYDGPDGWGVNSICAPGATFTDAADWFAELVHQTFLRSEQHDPRAMVTL